MNDRRLRLRSKARPALLWTTLFFFLGQFVIGLYLHRRHPEFFDPEMTLRLHKLPARLAEMPDRPLALVVGSSRIVMGLRPESVMAQAPDVPNRPILFNFSMLGAGPVGQRMLLHRLLCKGFQPKWLFVELWPPFLPQRFPYSEEANAFRHDCYWPDVAVLARLYYRGWEAAGQLLEQTLMPMLQHREIILEHYAPSLLPPLWRESVDRGFEKYMQYHLDDFGWVDNYLQPHPFLLARVRDIVKPLLLDNFFVNERSDLALRDLLEECRTHNIRVMFILMPDHSMVRGWYASMQDRLLPYLHRLSIENRAPIVDARDWQPDEDFPDGVHLSPRGARSFSERFGREVYRPLMQGAPPAKKILLKDAEQP